MFAFYYIGVKPHEGPKSLFYREVHNEIMILILSYHTFIFTDFMHSGLDGILEFGNIFVYSILEIFVVNLSFILYEFSKS